MGDADLHLRHHDLAVLFGPEFDFAAMTEEDEETLWNDECDEMLKALNLSVRRQLRKKCFS